MADAGSAAGAAGVLGAWRQSAVSATGWLEGRFKRWTIKRADGWFAYTDLSASLIAATGFCQRIDSNMLSSRRQQRGLGAGPVAIYLGAACIRRKSFTWMKWPAVSAGIEAALASL